MDRDEHKSCELYGCYTNNVIKSKLLFWTIYTHIYIYNIYIKEHWGHFRDASVIWFEACSSFLGWEMKQRPPWRVWTQPCVPGMPPNPWTFPSHRLKRNNLTKAMNQYQWFFDASVPPDISPGWCLFTNHTWFNLVPPFLFADSWFILHIVGWYTETPAVRAKIIRVRRLS